MDKHLKTLNIIVRLLMKGNCWYRVVGGLGIDGYVGRISRPHHDIDIIILEEQVERIKEVLRKNAYEFTLFNHKILLKIDDVTVELGRFQRNQKDYWLVTLPSHKWPADLLKGEEVTLEGIRFTVPSKEFLLSTKLSDKRKKSENDRRILEQLGCNTKTAKKHQFRDFSKQSWK